MKLYNKEKINQRYVNQGDLELKDLENPILGITIDLGEAGSIIDSKMRHEKVVDAFKEKNKFMQDFIDDQEKLEPDHTVDAEYRRLGLNRNNQGKKQNVKESLELNESLFVPNWNTIYNDMLVLYDETDPAEEADTDWWLNSDEYKALKAKSDAYIKSTMGGGLDSPDEGTYISNYARNNGRFGESYFSKLTLRLLNEDVEEDNIPEEQEEQDTPDSDKIMPGNIDADREVIQSIPSQNLPILHGAKTRIAKFNLTPWIEKISKDPYLVFEGTRRRPATVDYDKDYNIVITLSNPENFDAAKWYCDVFGLDYDIKNNVVMQGLKDNNNNWFPYSQFIIKCTGKQAYKGK